MGGQYVDAEDLTKHLRYIEDPDEYQEHAQLPHRLRALRNEVRRAGGIGSGAFSGLAYALLKSQ